MHNPPFAIHPGPVSTSPEAVDYNPAKIALLAAKFAELIERETIQCAGFIMARHGKIFAWQTMGPLRGFEDRGDFMPDSLRRVASVTKVYTAVAIMQLVESGRIYLEQPVAAIIPEFDTDPHRRINIFHLLTHTSGLAADPGYWKEPFPADYWRETDAENWIRRLLAGPLQSETGKVWSYSSIGFQILGEIVTRVAGLPYQQYVMERIVQPMGLTRTCFDPPQHLHDQVCMVAEGERRRLAGPAPAATVSAWKASGGLYSTLYDLCQLGQLFLNHGRLNGNELLGRKTLEAMVRNHLPGIPAYHWGDELKHKSYTLGLEINKDPLLSPGHLSHEGAGRCALWIDPAEDFIYAYMGPTAMAWSPEAVICPRGIAWSGIR